jgi:hypothetical protein
MARLVRHSVDRILHGGDNSGPGELDFGVGTMLALLATPGAFAAVFLADKYGSLFQFLRGEGRLNPYVASLPDEYFFVVLAMVVTGAVAVWKWDTLIPDHRDYANLAPLPIPAGRILLANITALLFLAGLLALDVNGASSVLFPLIVCGSESSLRQVAVFFATHLFSVVLASAFSFFAVLAVLGLLMAALPYRFFRKCSVYVRCGLIIFFMAMLSTSFIMVDLLQHPSSASRPLVQWISPVWFVALCQRLRGVADVPLRPLATAALIASIFALIVALCSYALSYRRCFAQSAEGIPNFSIAGHVRRHRSFDWLTKSLFNSSFERACFPFAFKTLFRSENHNLIVGAFVGMGIVLASQTLFRAHGTVILTAKTLPSASLLSIPLILAFFLLVGLRFSFEIPVALRANWIFRFTVHPETNECVPLARKIMLTCLLPLLLITLLCYGLLWGWSIGVIHTTVVAVLCLLLVEVLIVRFRKIPFTCSAPSFKSNALVSVFFYFLGFVIFTSWTSTAERWALSDPLWWLFLAAAVATAWAIVRRYRGEMISLDRRLIFEEQPDVAVQVLDLTFSRR